MRLKTAGENIKAQIQSQTVSHENAISDHPSPATAARIIPLPQGRNRREKTRANPSSTMRSDSDGGVTCTNKGSPTTSTGVSYHPCPS